jgi:hypothetical protein
MIPPSFKTDFGGFLHSGSGETTEAFSRTIYGYVQSSVLLPPVRILPMAVFLFSPLRNTPPQNVSDNTGNPVRRILR